jgi:membrane protease YdiL (CAAX protease family)
MLSSILIAQAISLLFGFSAGQFNLAEGFSFSYSLFPAWFMLILAPLMEELAWHSYGTDCLRARFSLFTTSVIFAVYWALWHFPLSFIKDYYHSNLVEIGWIYSLNFYFSIVPFVLIMNWLYYKTERNILIVIAFHISAGFFNEIFLTHPFSKVIQTVLLILLSIVLVIRERDFFFGQVYAELPDYQK